jgi:hypothetical protein
MPVESKLNKNAENQPGGYWILIGIVFIACIFAMFLVLKGKYHLKRFSRDKNFKQKAMPAPSIFLPKIIKEEKK